MTEQTRRATRLIEIARKLHRRPAGYSAAELARELGYSQRTIQRDLRDLESELGVPLMDAPGRRYKILPGSAPLAPVRFTLQEARAIYLASRLFARHADEQDPDGVSALEKLADTLPEAIGTQLEHTARVVQERPARKVYTESLRRLTDAWASQRTVVISYLSSGATEAKDIHLDPYLLEPMQSGAYVLGFSHEHGEVRTFKIDRVQSVEETDEHFEPKDVDEIIEQLSHGWGVVYGGDEQYDVTVDFTPAVERRVRETNWHPAQRLTGLEDGGVRLEVRLPSLLEFEPWVRSWGAEALVVGPPELREKVAREMRAAADRYLTP
jgi:predicted DNA-binding transcriptional regulator YafY